MFAAFRNIFKLGQVSQNGIALSVAMEYLAERPGYVQRFTICVSMP